MKENAKKDVENVETVEKSERGCDFVEGLLGKSPHTLFRRGAFEKKPPFLWRDFWESPPTPLQNPLTGNIGVFRVRRPSVGRGSRVAEASTPTDGI